MVGVLLDTNIIRRSGLLKIIAQKVEAGLINAFIPTIIHAERVRQLADAKGEHFSLQVIKTHFSDNPILFLEFSREDAEAIATVWLALKKNYGYTQDDWRKHRFDILLCAIAESRQMILITDDAHGQHFQLIPDNRRMNANEFEVWLNNLST
jgi:predicted nucleic acid-binding protein